MLDILMVFEDISVRMKKTSQIDPTQNKLDWAWKQ